MYRLDISPNPMEAKMSEKIELTALGSTEAQGCGDNCGCGSAKVAEPAKCTCGKGDVCVC